MFNIKRARIILRIVLIIIIGYDIIKYKIINDINCSFVLKQLQYVF